MSTRITGTLLAILLAGTLASCSTTGALQLPPSLTPGAITADVQQVQSIAVNLCGWRESLSVLARIIGTLAGQGAAVASASDIAAQVCAAVTPAKLGGRRYGARPAAVYGVRLQGHFVR